MPPGDSAQIDFHSIVAGFLSWPTGKILCIPINSIDHLSIFAIIITDAKRERILKELFDTSHSVEVRAWLMLINFFTWRPVAAVYLLIDVAAQ